MLRFEPVNDREIKSRVYTGENYICTLLLNRFNEPFADFRGGDIIITPSELRQIADKLDKLNAGESR